MKLTDFETWWYNEGSGIRNLPGEDMEEHADAREVAREKKVNEMVHCQAQAERAEIEYKAEKEV
jgi:hypothetical protein